MATYRLSRAAESDLEDIHYIGAVTFGLAQADRYYDGLVERLQRIADAPLRYPAVPTVREGYRRGVYGAHSISYRIETDHVFVVRIINRQDTGGI